MAFKAGAIYGEAYLDDTQWRAGQGRITKGVKSLTGILKTGLVVGFAAASAAIIKSTIAANNYQKELSNVNTLLDDTGAGLQGISGRLLSLDSELGSTTELTKGLYQAFSAGAEDADAAFAIVTQSAMFATAALTDQTAAVDILTTAMNAYGPEVVSAQQASDLYFTTIKKGKINGEQLSAVIGQSIPLFSSAGIGLEELTSGIAAMTKQGVSASETTTQLNAIVNSFLKPSEAMSAALKEVGAESGAAFLKTEGLSGALKLIESTTQGDAAAIAELLPNIRAMRGAMALTGTGGKEFNSILGEMENATGATEIAFGKQEKTFKTFRNELGKSEIIVGNVAKVFADKMAKGAQEALEALNKFLLSESAMVKFAGIASVVSGIFSSIAEAGRILGETMGPAFQELIGSVTEEFGDLAEGGEKNIDWVATFGDYLKFAGKAVSGLIIYVSEVVKVLGDWGRALSATGKLAAAFFAAMSNEGTWQEFKDQAAETGGAFKDLGVQYVGAYKRIFSEVKSTMGAAGDLLDVYETENQDTADRVREAFTTSAEKTRESVSKAYMGIVLGAKEAGDGIVETAKETGDDFNDATEEALNENKSLWTAWGNNLKDKFKEVADSVAWVLSSSAGLAQTLISGITEIQAQEFANQQADLDNKNAEESDALEKRYDSERVLLEEQLANGLISQEEFDDKSNTLAEDRSAAEVDLAKRQTEKKNKLAKKEFDNNKKMRQAQLWVDAASAVIAAWASLAGMGIAGIVLAGLETVAILALAGTQSAKISKQSFVPSREKGGMTGGPTMINERGGEIVTLPDGSQVIPNDISQQIAESVGEATGGNQISVSFAGANIGSNMDLNRIVAVVSARLGAQLQTTKG